MKWTWHFRAHSNQEMRWLCASALATLAVLSASVSCRPRRSYRDSVEITVGASQRERIRYALALTAPTGVEELRQAMRKECREASDANLETLSLRAVWLPQSNEDRGPDVWLQVALECMPDQDTEAIVRCGKATLQRTIREESGKKAGGTTHPENR
jgi:hypothetical protein